MGRLWKTETLSKRQLVLVTLTACDCEEQVEILSRGNREASIRV